MDNLSKGHHHIRWCSLGERHVRRICYPNIGSSSVQNDASRCGKPALQKQVWY